MTPEEWDRVLLPYENWKHAIHVELHVDRTVQGYAPPGEDSLIAFVMHQAKEHYKLGILHAQANMRIALGVKP